MKLAATKAVLALATYGLGDGTPTGATRRLAEQGLPAVLAQQAGALLRPDAESAADIVYPQIAGISATAADVMVVVDVRSRRARKPIQVVRRVVEVQLAKTGGSWVPGAIGSVGGDPVSGLVPPANVATLLANPKVELSDSNRWDLLAGRIDPRIVDLLNRLSVAHRLAVAVLVTGHPAMVFQTDRPSNHAAGRAVDIWAVDGVPVADLRAPGSSLETLVRQLVAEGVTELGSPFDLDGRGGAMFTDLVHQDHIHLGYRR